MPSIKEIELEIAEEFAELENWEEKYDYLIELGQDMPPLDEAYKKDEHLIKGCQSSVWFVINCKEGKLKLAADSDSLIVKGIVAILQRMLSGQPAQAILEADLILFEKLGLWNHLSSQRSTGVTAILAHLKAAAEKCRQQAELEDTASKERFTGG